jgi:hypothetical protein
MSLNNTDQQLKLKTGTTSQITTVVNDLGVQGEPLYATDTGELYIHNGTEYVPLITNATPSSATDTGIKGQVAYDTNYIYVCVNSNVWKRVSISTW